MTDIVSTSSWIGNSTYNAKESDGALSTLASSVDLSKLNDFEKVAYADCKFRSGILHQIIFDSYLKVRNILGIPCFILSLVAGFWITYQYKSRSPYPNLFIAYICLCQAGYIGTLYYWDYNFCESQLPTLLLNSIANKDSYISTNILGGFYIFEISHLEASGALIILWVWISHVFLYAE